MPPLHLVGATFDDATYSHRSMHIFNFNFGLLAVLSCIVTIDAIPVQNRAPAKYVPWQRAMVVVTRLKFFLQQMHRHLLRLQPRTTLRLRCSLPSGKGVARSQGPQPMTTIRAQTHSTVIRRKYVICLCTPVVSYSSEDYS